MVYVSEIVIFHQTRRSPNTKHHKLHTVLCHILYSTVISSFSQVLYTLLTETRDGFLVVIKMYM